MRFISNVAGWTQLTQLFDFLSYFRWRNDWHLWYHFCSLYILSWISLAQGDPVLSCLLGKKEKKVAACYCPNMRCYRGYSPLEDYEICTVQKHSFYRKNQKFLVLELSSYILSVPSFSSLCWPYFSLEFSPFFRHCLLSTTDKTKVFYGSLLSQQSFPPFSRFFLLKSNDHVNITTTLMLHICYCALCINTVFEKFLKWNYTFTISSHLLKLLLKMVFIFMKNV